MAKLYSFDQALEYANRLGFAGSGNIAYRSANLCKVAEILTAHKAGIDYTNDPIIVKFEKHHTGIPRYGKFRLRTDEGVKVIWYNHTEDTWVIGDSVPLKAHSKLTYNEAYQLMNNYKYDTYSYYQWAVLQYTTKLTVLVAMLRKHGVSKSTATAWAKTFLDEHV